MSLELLREMLLWSTIINYVLLVFWVLTVILRWNGLYDRCAKGFHVSREKVDSVNFAGIVLYKTAIILFNLTPLIALSIVDRKV